MTPFLHALLPSLVLFFSFIDGCAAEPAASEKPFRVGMSWLFKDESAFVSYERWEVVKVEKEKVTFHVTTLNAKKEPFAGDQGIDSPLPILKVKDLLPGKEEKIEAAGRTFLCRKIESPGGTTWRSLEYPLISIRQETEDSKKEVVEFKP